MKNFNPVSVHDELEKLAEKYAEAKHAYDLLAETKKSVYAQYLLKADGATVGEREAQALTNKEYKAHLKLMVDTGRNMHIAKMAYDNFKIKVDVARSLEATNRHLMR